MLGLRCVHCKDGLEFWLDQSDKDKPVHFLNQNTVNGKAINEGTKVACTNPANIAILQPTCDAPSDIAGYGNCTLKKRHTGPHLTDIRISKEAADMLNKFPEEHGGIAATTVAGGSNIGYSRAVFQKEKEEMAKPTKETQLAAMLKFVLGNVSHIEKTSNGESKVTYVVDDPIKPSIKLIITRQATDTNAALELIISDLESIRSYLERKE